jgi:hypothetical protein
MSPFLLVAVDLVIVDDLDVGGTAVGLRPLETDAPLIIDADAVLPLAISAQQFDWPSSLLWNPNKGPFVYPRHRIT